MARGQDQSQGSMKVKKQSLKKAKPSSKQKNTQKLSYKQSARVNIGGTLARWRALKDENGMRTDADVAQCLLDAYKCDMKRIVSTSDFSGGKGKKIKVSKSEVQTMIEDEVRRMVKKKETKLQGLLESIDRLDQRFNYADRIKVLEARLHIVANRAETALASMEKIKSTSPSPAMQECKSAPEAENEESATQNQGTMIVKSETVFHMMESTKNALKQMNRNNEGLAAQDLPPADSPHDSSECKGIIIKEEQNNWEDHQAKVEVSEQYEEPKVKAESLAPVHDCGSQNAETEKDKNSYPPLPPTTFPSILNAEAASYNIPQKPEVRLALIRNPASLSVLWTVSEKDPSAPPMDSYSIYMAMEKVKGSGIFPKWRAIGEVTAIDLPMCVMMSKYKPGHKVCVAVVGKDKFGRYGPYSEVVSAAIPE